MIKGMKVVKKFIRLIFRRIFLFALMLLFVSDKCDRATFLKAPGTNSITTIHCVAAEYIPSSPYPDNLIRIIVVTQLVMA